MNNSVSDWDDQNEAESKRYNEMDIVFVDGAASAKALVNTSTEEDSLLKIKVKTEPIIDEVANSTITTSPHLGESSIVRCNFSEGNNKMSASKGSAKILKITRMAYTPRYAIRGKLVIEVLMIRKRIFQ